MNINNRGENELVIGHYFYYPQVMDENFQFIAEVLGPPEETARFADEELTYMGGRLPPSPH